MSDTTTNQQYVTHFVDSNDTLKTYKIKDEEAFRLSEGNALKNRVSVNETNISKNTSDITDINTKLTDEYYNKEGVDYKLTTEYYTKDNINATLDNYDKTSVINEKLEQLKSDVLGNDSDDNELTLNKLNEEKYTFPDEGIPKKDLSEKLQKEIDNKLDIINVPNGSYNSMFIKDGKISSVENCSKIEDLMPSQDRNVKNNDELDEWVSKTVSINENVKHNPVDSEAVIKCIADSGQEVNLISEFIQAGQCIRFINPNQINSTISLPSDLTVGGFLIWKRDIQLIIADSIIYIRFSTNEDNNWTPWTKLTTQLDLDSLYKLKPNNTKTDANSCIESNNFGVYILSGNNLTNVPDEEVNKYFIETRENYQTATYFKDESIHLAIRYNKNNNWTEWSTIITSNEISSYYNKQEIDAIFEKYYTKDNVDDKYYTKIETDEILNDYSTKDNLNNTLEQYYSKDDIQSEYSINEKENNPINSLALKNLKASEVFDTTGLWDGYSNSSTVHIIDNPTGFDEIPVEGVKYSLMFVNNLKTNKINDIPLKVYYNAELIDILEAIDGIYVQAGSFIDVLYKNGNFIIIGNPIIYQEQRKEIEKNTTKNINITIFANGIKQLIFSSPTNYNVNALATVNFSSPILLSKDNIISSKKFNYIYHNYGNIESTISAAKLANFVDLELFDNKITLHYIACDVVGVKVICR